MKSTPILQKKLLEPGTALNMIDELENAIISLEQFPERGAIRHIGAYSLTHSSVLCNTPLFLMTFRPQSIYEDIVLKKISSSSLE